MPLSTVFVGSGVALPAAYAEVEFIVVISIAVISNLLNLILESAFVVAILVTAYLPKCGVLTLPEWLSNNHFELDYAE